MSRQGQNSGLFVTQDMTQTENPRGGKMEVTSDKLSVMAFSANLDKGYLPDEY